MVMAKAYLAAREPGRCWLRSERRIRDTAPRSHRELVAFLVVSGRMRYLIDDRVLSLGAGALLWAHTDQSHVLLEESDDFDMWVLVAAPWVLRPARLFPPRLAAGSTAEARMLDDAAAAELGAVGAQLRRAADPVRVAIGLRWWVAQAWEAWQHAATTPRRRVHPAVRRAAEILRADADATLAQVARRAGLSLSHLARVFRADTGVGLAAFRTARRLERVDAAMAQTRAPLLGAALDAGFGSYAQFYRAFIAARGVNPRRYYRGIDDAIAQPSPGLMPSARR
jgi:AraC-like DNA-binding protein